MGVGGSVGRRVGAGSSGLRNVAHAKELISKMVTKMNIIEWLLFNAWLMAYTTLVLALTLNDEHK